MADGSCARCGEFPPETPTRSALGAAWAIVLKMAEDQLADIESGIADGLYDLKSNVDLPKKQSAIKVVAEHLRNMAAPVAADHYSQRAAIERLAVAANMDDVCTLTPYALQRLEVFGKLFSNELTPLNAQLKAQ